PPPPPPPLPLGQSRALSSIKVPRSPVPRSVVGSSSLRPWGAGTVVGCLADFVSKDGDSGRTGTVKMHFFLNGNPVNGNASVPIFTATVA
ncbi:unnamed protein product, partial [Sphacelaria rigidula]